MNFPNTKPCIVLDVNEHQQLLTTACTRVKYTIAFSTGNWCELFLKQASDSDDHMNIFYIRKLKCPVGFAEVDKICQCDVAFTSYKMITCDINDKAILRPANM